TKRLKSPIRELSKGFKQRTGLAQALIHDPKVLILDEPTSGLDPMQIIEIRKLIRRLAEHHVVVFSTHILSEADAISDRLVIINRGRIVANGTSAELASSAVSEQKVQLVVSGLPDALTGDLSEIEEVTGVDVRRAAEGYAKFILTVKGGARQLRAACEQAASLAYVRGRAVAEISPQLVTLEEVFLRLLRETSEPIEAHSVAATSLEEEGGEVPDTSKGDLEVYPIPVSPVEKPSSGPDTSFGDESESDRRMAELRNIRPDTTSIAFEERADSGEFSVRPETGAADGDKGSGNGGDVALEPKDWEDA
ncbi:MAG: ABC transporter ATP-binding protein, partial [Nitrospira sp.]|nr:ABC transporter ATP-binding protein [Nitrospira sp.]